MNRGVRRGLGTPCRVQGMSAWKLEFALSSYFPPGTTRLPKAGVDILVGSGDRHSHVEIQLGRSGMTGIKVSEGWIRRSDSS
jgi:hypothetical protein